ncbi:hypothetical protein COLO4_04254 [Corchorus olitorius]|uniref:Uncharacterized protein n=1 Tax=Corchorus olitorius TaxID=93759 RepID=A0A1R3KUT3_9ROSI|nr:hypothetical protein COLO4_04254 [Corchorus olitorius]
MAPDPRTFFCLSSLSHSSIQFQVNLSLFYTTKSGYVDVSYYAHIVLIL